MLFLIVLRSFHCSCLFNDFIMRCHNSLFADWVEVELRVGDISDTKPLVSVFRYSMYVSMYMYVVHYTFCIIMMLCRDILIE